MAALAFAAEHPALSGSYNVGYGERLTVNTLVAHILRLCGVSDADELRTLIHNAPERPGDIKHSVSAADKQRAAGWRLHHTTLARALCHRPRGAE